MVNEVAAILWTAVARELVTIQEMGIKIGRDFGELAKSSKIPPDFSLHTRN